MNWVVLVPPGDEVTAHVADVARPTIVPAHLLEKWARAVELRRQWEQLMAELGDDVAPVTPAVQGCALDDDTAEPVDVAEPEPAALRPQPQPRAERSIDERKDPETGEVVRGFKLPGPRYACVCRLVFTTPTELKRHRARCAEAKRHRDLDGKAEPGQFKWGNVS